MGLTPGDRTALRWGIFQRDEGCIAVQPDKVGDAVSAEPCRNSANWVIPWNDVFQMEWNHVKEAGAIGLGIKAPDDEAHGVTLCAFHHRGTAAGSNWEAANREAERKYLRSLYPEVWGEGEAADSPT